MIMKLACHFRWRYLLYSAKTMCRGSYAMIAVLLGMLVWTMVIVDEAWNSTAEANVSPAGYVVMAFGVLLSLVVGIGLMALVSYSSRAGYDEPAKLGRELIKFAGHRPAESPLPDCLRKPPQAESTSVERQKRIAPN